MKLLKDILYTVPILEASGSTDVEIKHIEFDSRKVGPGCLFVAVKGTQVDGHKFISRAEDDGAIAIICAHMPENRKDGVSYVVAKDTALALGVLSSNFYNNPSRDLMLVGITGTNGKTTCATLLHQLFLSLGYQTGLLSTVENKIGEEVLKSTHTTPDAVSLNKLLRDMVNAGCSHCFMEVSSHALVQHRVSGLKFAGAAFTNISHDHLDYHKTFAEYISAKKLLFDGLEKNAFALINGDDRRANVMVQNSKADKKFYALKTLADFKGKILSNSLQGLEMDIDNRDAWFRLIGDFNAYNLLAVYGTACLLGEDPDEVLTQLSVLGSVPGRFEQITSGSAIVGIVDYAHTPDALENVLKTIQELKGGTSEIITMVGCGGNRDRDKRPEMTRIACELSDKVIITSDNPRDEEPMDIINEMKKGASPTMTRKIITMEDRREAIKLACTLAKSEDIILLAGKGHENYQEIKGERHHFDDREELKGMFKLLEK